jgi:hypothetical protein
MSGLYASGEKAVERVLVMHLLETKTNRTTFIQELALSFTRRVDRIAA